MRGKMRGMKRLFHLFMALARLRGKVPPGEWVAVSWGLLKAVFCGKREPFADEAVPEWLPEVFN